MDKIASMHTIDIVLEWHRIHKSERTVILQIRITIQLCRNLHNLLR